jgi:hypothetical protein
VDLDFIGVRDIGLVMRNENAIFLLLRHSQNRIDALGSQFERIYNDNGENAVVGGWALSCEIT